MDLLFYVLFAVVIIGTIYFIVRVNTDVTTAADPWTPDALRNDRTNEALFPSADRCAFPPFRKRPPRITLHYGTPGTSDHSMYPFRKVWYPALHGWKALPRTCPFARIP